jgi:hypothetical protein
MSDSESEIVAGGGFVPPQEYEPGKEEEVERNESLGLQQGGAEISDDDTDWDDPENDWGDLGEDDE